jgi:hypothetical protein
MNTEKTAQFEAIRHLGWLRDSRAKATLDKLAVSKDPIIRGRALAAKIRIGDPPDTDALIEFLKIDPAESSDRRLPQSLWLRDYIAILQRDIIEAVWTSVETKELGKSIVVTKAIGEFDYIGFCSRLVKIGPLQNIRDEKYARQRLIHTITQLEDRSSIPLLHELLNDADVEVRYSAVAGLMRIFGERKIPSERSFEKDEKAYISYCGLLVPDSE